MQAPAKILVENAAKTFIDGSVVAFRNLTLAVRPNEVLCIVGPSGCGKTTLLRCIDGLIPLSHGRVLIDGQLVREPSAQVAIVFQHFGLFPWKTVVENVAYGLRLRGASRDEGRRRAARRPGPAGPAKLVHGRDVPRHQEGRGARGA